MTEIKQISNQEVLDKTMSYLIQKLDDRDRIIDLELKNISKSIKLDIQEQLKIAHENLEKKIDIKIREAIGQQQQKISWGIELTRFIIVLVLFVLSVKMVNPL